MQELINDLKNHFLNSSRDDSFDATKYLQKEKEQMIEMYYKGHTAPYFSQYGNDVVKQAEYCYNQTYNKNK